jgi:diaminopimelate decarboxylase
MAYFYHEDRLKLGTPSASIDLADLAAKNKSPLYVYDLDDISLRYRALESALNQTPHAIHYAMKANANPGILKLLGSLGSGVDTVSGGEIRLALAAGFKPEDIIFSGVGKTVSELELAIDLRIKQINVESPQELERIARIAARKNQKADIAFRLNPDVNPQTHPYITTGFRENKFGMDESAFPVLLDTLTKASRHLRLRGLTMHIGSQLLDLSALEEAMSKTANVFRTLKAAGHADLDRVDIGGGLGIDYSSSDDRAEFERLNAYGSLIQRAFGGLHCEILLEPGRVLVARAGLLIGEVQYIKEAPAKTFAILNTGMHHLLRPALYGARHRVLPLHKRETAPRRYDIVGPICESSDVLARDVDLGELRQGDFVAIADAGAYGFSMASRYNAHELPDELLVVNGQTLASESVF